ncbi:methionyl-tRNA formyltransferase [candidate division KSB1 bacterium]|nr:methionyl-tRNA formyltransferase [candidate division KSB1 bacterium]
MRKRLKRHKIVYMGGNLIGCMCLRELLRMRIIDVVAVVGRYQDNGSVVDPRAWNASLLRVAMQKGLPFLQPRDLRDPANVALLMEQGRPDFILSVQYDHIPGPELMQWPTRGCINMRYAKLPSNRGFQPIPWALVDEQPVGVTMHWMDEKRDVGDIIASDDVDVLPDDTAHSLYFKVTQVAFQMFKHVFPQVVAGEAPRIPPSGNGHTFYGEDYPYNRTIDWSWDEQKIDRMVRALTFPASPSARTYFQDMELEVLNPVDIMVGEKNGHKPGEIVEITDKGLVVQSAGHRVLISKVRINRTLLMDAVKFSQQFDVKVGDILKSSE